MANLADLTFHVCQLNFSVGDLHGNKEKIIDSIKKAQNEKIDVVIFPETATTGYPAKDLLKDDSFLQGLSKSINEIVKETEGIAVILGSPYRDKNGIFRNAAILIENKKVTDVVFKTLLPDYDVFDESRHFEIGEPKVVEFQGIKLGIQICEDAWDHLWVHDIPVTVLQKKLGADIIINISASPYTMTKPQNRLNLIREHVKKINIPFIYVNLIGGQDDLVFDGRSFALNETGDLVFTANKFEEDRVFLSGKDFETRKIEQIHYYSENIESEWIEAIVINLRDYLEKSGLSNKLLVPVSGGIDSAITLFLCVKAVGSDNVIGVFLPTKFSSLQSEIDAKEVCKSLDVKFMEISVEDIRNLFMKILWPMTEIEHSWGTAEENIQARIRATLMMYLSNKMDALLISTGNKSEIAVGYCTLYGDTAGGKNLIGDLYKTQVYDLAKYINKNKLQIPPSIINKPPSAELKENQLDTDTLPAYEVLDKILAHMIDGNKSLQSITQMGYDPQIVKMIAKMVKSSEFKRNQLVQSVKLSKKAFGFGRRMPIANGYNN